MMNDHRLPVQTPASDSEVMEFVSKVRNMPTVKTRSGQGRLIFALDATASRQPAWDRACQLQGEMFVETEAVGSLNVQLVWYRGLSEFDISPWCNEASALLQRMNRVFCAGGFTQIGRVLNHAIQETRQHRINALVFIGDCVEENPHELCRLAGQLGLLGVPAFIFHEGNEPVAAGVFRQIAQLTRGAYCSFDAGSAKQLRDLLSAVAIYAAGGLQALEDFGKRRGGLALQLTRQIKG
jgi:hypothetical protein